MSSARIVEVARDRAGCLRFWRAGLAPYAGDPHFVTPLFADCRHQWSPDHPFFEHAETVHLVAVRDGRDVGRVAATVDRRQHEFEAEGLGLFGWFECERDAATAHALLDAAAAWLRDRGCDRVRGPLSYTTNGISGLLLEDDEPGPPVFGMAYNPDWYRDLLADWGLTKAKDLVALWLDRPEQPVPLLEKITRRLTERRGVRLRPMRTSRDGYAADVEHILAIYNGAWERNWGFVPLTEAEIRDQARSMKPVLVPDLVLFAEREGRPVAFSLTLPDLNQALRHIRGRLWPWSLARFLWEQRRIDAARVLTLGVLPDWRRSGLDAALIHATMQGAGRHGIDGGECSWILEDNELMIASLIRSGARVYRRYRVYERAL